jgi:hypothetical protein
LNDSNKQIWSYNKRYYYSRILSIFPVF